MLRSLDVFISTPLRAGCLRSNLITNPTISSRGSQPKASETQSGEELGVVDPLPAKFSPCDTRQVALLPSFRLLTSQTGLMSPGLTMPQGSCKGKVLESM